MSAQRGYLVLQGLAVVGWWVLLVTVPATHDLFVPAGDPTLPWAWLPADIFIVAGGSLYAAARWESAARPPVVWVVAGALWSTTAYLVVLWSYGSVGVLGPGMMLLASAGTGWAAMAGTYEQPRV